MPNALKNCPLLARLVLIPVMACLAPAAVPQTPTASRSGLADLAPVATVLDCSQLKDADFSSVTEAWIHVTSAAVAADGQPAPYCKVLGYVAPHVEFEVRLPVAGWTQRFLQTGCGGLCGNTNIRVSNADDCLPAQHGELALASTNMGHSGPGAAWAVDKQSRIDFAYRGVHVTAVAAKALIAKYYGRPPKFSYFAGCSDGGREALMEAQRFPADFNGITAGAPAMNFTTQNTFYHAWNARVNTDADGHAVLTAEKLPILHAAAVTACDALDGLKDGLISEPRLCRFDPAVVECKPGQDQATCLTTAQVETARQVYRGARDSKGRQLVIGGPQPGSELAWRGVFVPNSPTQPTMSGQISLDTIRYMIYPETLPASFSLADFQFTEQTFDGIKPAHPIYDATDPDLSAFSSAGGKLILWHGWQDPHISPLNTIAYYTTMQALMGNDHVKEFARFYLFPGGYHCGGGEGPFEVDLLSPIMAWVERGDAPYKLIASHTAGPSGPPPPRPDAQRGKPDRTRPVFPYPLVAVYTGTGSIDDAANFVPRMPANNLPDHFDWLGSSFFRPGYELWCKSTGGNFTCGRER
jgi:hypothetical protein